MRYILYILIALMVYYLSLRYIEYQENVVRMNKRSYEITVKLIQYLINSGIRENVTPIIVSEFFKSENLPVPIEVYTGIAGDLKKVFNMSDEVEQIEIGSVLYITIDNLLSRYVSSIRLISFLISLILVIFLTLLLH